MTKVVLYGRVSSEEQAIEGRSLETQREKLEGYAKVYDLEVVAYIEDAGISAKNLDREGLQEALSMLDSGEADGIVVVKLDRLSRSTRDWGQLIDDYFSEKAGKQLLSVGDSIDTRTAAGRLVLNILMSVFQWEREACGERTKAVLQHKIKRGERVGRLRYGYDQSAEGRLVENAHEQAAIAAMRAWRAESVPYRKIATRLETEGFRTKDGRPWQAMTVKQILDRKVNVETLALAGA